MAARHTIKKQGKIWQVTKYSFMELVLCNTIYLNVCSVQLWTICGAIRQHHTNRCDYRSIVRSIGLILCVCRVHFHDC